MGEKIFHSFLFICLDRREKANFIILFGWERNEKANLF